LRGRFRAFFDAMARPKPEVDGQKDPRTAGQRRHDAVLDGLKLLARAELLPQAGGVTTTVTLFMNQDAFETGGGTATTGHGVILPAKQVLMWLDGETRVVPVVFDNLGRIVATGTGQRLFSENQRLAMAARDSGGPPANEGVAGGGVCSFPGCDSPPQWTQAHHVIEYAEGGPTCTEWGSPRLRGKLLAVRVPSPRVRENGMASPHARRRPTVDPTGLDRRHPDTQNQQHPQPDAQLTAIHVQPTT
jgi:hypothetical protein